MKNFWVHGRFNGTGWDWGDPSLSWILWSPNKPSNNAAKNRIILHAPWKGLLFEDESEFVLALPLCELSNTTKGELTDYNSNSNLNYFIKISPFVIIFMKQLVCNLKLQKPLITEI